MSAKKNSHQKTPELNRLTACTPDPLWINPKIEPVKPYIPPRAMPNNRPLFNFDKEKVSLTTVEELIDIYNQTGKPKKIALPIISSNHTGNPEKILLYSTHKTRVKPSNGKNTTCALSDALLGLRVVFLLLLFDGIKDYIQSFLLIVAKSIDNYIVEILLPKINCLIKHNVIL